MMMFNKMSGFLSSGHIVQMYFPSPFEVSCLNRAWVMGLHVDILLGEVISGNRNEETGKKKTNSNGKLNPRWTIVLLFQWKLELNLSPNPLRSLAGSNMELTSWKEEEGYFNHLLVKDWSRGYYPFADMCFCVPLDDGMSSPTNSFQWLGKKPLCRKKDIHHATKPWYCKAINM